MKKVNEQPNKLSYESDGKMGDGKERQDTQKEKKDFFNVTQDSE
ncbi:MAG: hypothetical protein Q8934_19980 [Bacillota bacterium]|nr:hypothetical protein [Bacillota bacterium]